MNIVIVGASDIGIHLANIFSRQQHNITLIDLNQKKLEMVSRELDAATRFGSGTDWMILEELLETSPELILALTDDDETNLITCCLAKNLGYKGTVARIREDRYLNSPRLNVQQIFCVDYLIGPEKLTAEAIAHMILIPDSLYTESFSNGAITMRTLQVPQKWRKANKPIAELQIPEQVMIGLIQRPSLGKMHQDTTIFPHGKDQIEPLDEVTFIGESEAINQMHRFFGQTPQVPQSVVIIGGSIIAMHLAGILQHRIEVKIIEKDYDKCCYLSEKLPYCIILHHDGLDLPFLESEKIGEDQVLIACTRKDEVNVMAAIVGKKLQCKNVIVSLSDIDYIPLIKDLGIQQASSPKIQAANRLLSIAREKTIASMVSMYEGKAEIMEVKVSLNSKIAGIPIKQLGPELPKDFLIVAIQSRGRVLIANGNQILTPGDTVIVISHPKHIEEMKKLF